MRVTGFSLFSSLDEEPLNFGMLDGDTSPQFGVHSVVGLDAEALIPRYYGKGAVSGVPYFDVKPNPREIVMRILLQPRFQIDESYSDARDALYRLISRSRTGMLNLHLKAGAAVIATTFGSITKFEASHFTNVPEVQITFYCPDGMLRAPEAVELGPTDIGTESSFTIIDNLSTAPHGFHMHVEFTATSPSLTLQDDPTTPDWKFKVIPSGGFLVGDVFHMDTNPLDNHITVERGATSIHLADKIEPGSILPVIFPGNNTFHIVELTGGGALKFDWMDFTYFPAYWGV